jgi:hypothetical protein
MLPLLLLKVPLLFTIMVCHQSPPHINLNIPEGALNVHQLNVNVQQILAQALSTVIVDPGFSVKLGEIDHDSAFIVTEPDVSTHQFPPYTLPQNVDFTKTLFLAVIIPS